MVREYLHYKADQSRVYDGLMTIARATAVSVERDLQFRVSELQTLAISSALQSDNLVEFDRQAEDFLTRQPAGSVIGLTSPDLQRLRVYGLPAGLRPARPRDATAPGNQVFATRLPVVTDMHVGQVTGLSGFRVDVPVYTDDRSKGDRVAYDLYIRILPTVIADLIAREHLPPGAAITVVDRAGAIVAGLPAPAPTAGAHIIPALWDVVRTNTDGLTKELELRGSPAVVAFAQVAPFGWAVIVDASKEIVLGPLRDALTRVTELGTIVLAAALLLALFASRGIIRPISQLRRLAAQDDRIATDAGAPTGLPETDTVALALGTAALRRQTAARELAESEARFRALFERSPSGTILIDPETTQIIDCNEASATQVGYSVEEFCTRRITDFALETKPERIHELCLTVAAGASAQYETRISGRNGPRDLLIAVAPVQVSGRTLVLLNQIDVTDLRLAEAGLRANKERLALARDGAKLGIWDWDVGSERLTWNEKNWRLHGLAPSGAGPSLDEWQRTVHQSDVVRVVNALRTASGTLGSVYATEYSVALPDGSPRRLLTRGQTVLGSDGLTVRMVGISMDVTARYEAEMARDHLIYMLETERSRLAEIVEALPVGVGIVDASGRIVLGNPLMKRLNTSVIQSMGAEPHGEWIADDADGKRLALEDFPIRRALQLGETTLPGIDFLFRDTDGSETWFRVGSVPLRWEEGQVKEALGIFLDIDAEQRLMEIQQQINTRLEQRVRDEMTAREAAQQRAAHAERMHALGQIAGGIAHDFNNVLQAVTGGAALIERRPENTERVLRNVRMVLDAAKRGAAITSRLLAFSRRGSLRAESVDAASLLADMAEVLTHTLGGSIVCEIDVPPGLPPMLADRGQLETVLVNLATNARDAMSSGGTLTLAADAEMVSTGLPHPAGLASGGYVRIVVSDTGTGIDRAVLARVTEPFFTTKAPGKGTGLGLAMAKSFVEQSGGSLSIDSVTGEGTRVMLWLPRAPEPRTSGTRSANTAVTCATGAGTVVRATDDFADFSNVGTAYDAHPDKQYVLLVDDDAIVREVLTLSLEDAGYIVLPADSGTAALMRLESDERVDIIVSDLKMPEMDGLTLIRSAQQLQPGLPAVLLTGYASDDATLAVGGATTGAFSLLRKPVSGTQLVGRISALLPSRRQTSRL